MNNNIKNLAKKFRQNKKALSPAIAIALLLSITIALVAAVGYSATVVTPTVSTAPQGTFDVNIYKDSGVVIKEISGDSIPSSDLTLKFIADGVETVVQPTGNNTIYVNWGVYNPGAWTDGIDPRTGEGYLYKDQVGKFELADTNGDPLPVTAVGIQITDVVSQVGDHLVDPEGIWFDPDISVQLYNSTSKQYVPATALEPYPTSMEYREAWHDCTSPYLMYYVANPDNTSFSKVQITRAGCTFTVDIPLAPSTSTYMSDQPGLSEGHALYFRLSEYNSPFLWSASVIPTRDMSASFGEYTVSPGTVLQSVGPAYSSYGVFGHQALISNWNAVASGDLVHVYIIHSPSNVVVWQGDVMVQ